MTNLDPERIPPAPIEVTNAKIRDALTIERLRILRLIQNVFGDMPVRCKEIEPAILDPKHNFMYGRQPRRGTPVLSEDTHKDPSRSGDNDGTTYTQLDLFTRLP